MISLCFILRSADQAVATRAGTDLFILIIKKDIAAVRAMEKVVGLVIQRLRIIAEIIIKYPLRKDKRQACRNKYRHGDSKIKFDHRGAILNAFPKADRAAGPD